MSNAEKSALITPPILDLPYLESIIALSQKPTFKQHIIDSFIADTEYQIQKLNKAIKQDNQFSLQEIAHAIKGSARSIGAIALAELTQQIEEEARHGNEEKLLVLNPKLHHIFEVTKTTLTSYLDTSS